jgi:hypothetical protein
VSFTVPACDSTVVKIENTTNPLKYGECPSSMEDFGGNLILEGREAAPQV